MSFRQLSQRWRLDAGTKGPKKQDQRVNKPGITVWYVGLVNSAKQPFVAQEPVPDRETCVRCSGRIGSLFRCIEFPVSRAGNSAQEMAEFWGFWRRPGAPTFSENMRFPVNRPITGDIRERAGFAQDCVAHQTVPNRMDFPPSGTGCARNGAVPRGLRAALR